MEMTREEAARIIKECKEKGFKHTFYTLNEYHTALDMAIKALESMPEVTVFRSGQIDTRTVEQATAEIKKLLEEGYFDKASFSIESPSKRSEQTGEKIADFVEAMFQTDEELLSGEREGISASEMMAMGDALVEGFRKGLNGGADVLENRTSEMMTLDEAIKHAEEVAEENEEIALYTPLEMIPADTSIEACKKCAKEHRQLAGWLKDYKRLKEQEPKSFSSIASQQKYEDITKAFQFGLAFGFGKKYDEMDEVIDEIKKVITPKTGHWINELGDWNSWTCSECGFTKRTDVHVRLGYTFCPKCGAMMVEPQEREEQE